MTIHGSSPGPHHCGCFAPRRVGAFRKYWSNAKMQKILQQGGQMIFPIMDGLSMGCPCQPVIFLAEA